MLILLMVLLGGATRLTGSGLSIVEWRPVTGAIPPLNEQQWQAEFAKYQTSPEFRSKNADLTLDGFRRIFLWEYVHRLVGRLLGMLLLLPGIYLLVRRRGPWWVRKRFVYLTLLVALQGLMGWLMVMSGLVDRPQVSHFRLAAHFLLAVITLLAVVWTWSELAEGRKRLRSAPRRVWGVGALLFSQLLYGAFLAGTKAGWAFPTFPTLNGEWFPTGGWADQLGLANIVENGLFIHWFHRVLATLLLAVIWVVAANSRGAARKAAMRMASVVTLQYLLGIITVLAHIPVPLGVAHQFVAILLATAWLRWGYVLAEGRASG
jgi:cytochrome c oxidase assembly protein subunit 15